ncbi:glucosaminidase domain-containing protein [Paenibacillus sp. SI8]|uniref:glucosaminidase domain-containing protein n=1 Tax=unclassified Paenibacillus TaxID=185978 RepID=UPI003467DBD0
MSKRSFINEIASAAIEDMLNTGVLASITIAQACLESAWGQSAPGNNLFGIKGSGTTQATEEFINGQWITINAGFRAYQNWYGSIQDHSQFLCENGRYGRAGFFDHCAARDYAGAAKALQTAGYATDPQYASKLIQIIESNGLQKIDQEADMMFQEIIELKDQVQTLLSTAEAHIKEINALKAKASMPVPDWANEAIESAVSSGLIDTPDGRSYDFYALLTVFHRNKLI